MAVGVNALEVEINRTPDNGTTNKWVSAFLQMIDKSRSLRSNYDVDIKKIDTLIDDVTEVDDPQNSPKKTNSHVIPLAVHKAMAKTKFPSFWLECESLNKEKLNLTTSLFYDFVEKSKLVDIYESKSGGMKRVYEVGDTLIKYGINPKNDLPIFSDESFSNFFPSPFATEMRTSTGERSLRQGVLLFKYSWEQAVELFKDDNFEKKATVGDLPNVDTYRSGAYTDEQQTEMDEREVEVGLCFDLDKEIFLMMAGSTAAVIRFKEGRDNKDPDNDYPYFIGEGKDREAYFPAVHLRGILKTKGFPNYCFGQIFYKSALAERRNKNQGLLDMEFNINSKKVLSVGNITASEWNKHSQIADEFIARGRQGVIPVSLDQGQQVSVTSTRSEPLTGEFERTTDVIAKDILRWFNIDSNITDTRKTLGALEMEEESQDLILNQIAKNNVEEVQFALELLLNFLKNEAEAAVTGENGELVKAGNTTTLRTRKRLTTGEDVPQIEDGQAVTVGELAEMIQTHDIKVKVSGESGVETSRTLRRLRAEAHINRIAAFNPQNPAIPGLMQDLFKGSGFSLSDEHAQALIGGGQPQGGQPQPQEGAGGIAPNEPELQKLVT